MAPREGGPLRNSSGHGGCTTLENATPVTSVLSVVTGRQCCGPECQSMENSHYTMGDPLCLSLQAPPSPLTCLLPVGAGCPPGNRAERAELARMGSREQPFLVRGMQKRKVAGIAPQPTKTLGRVSSWEPQKAQEENGQG